MPEVELLDKTELWIHGVFLEDVDLREFAAAAATALGLDPSVVFVTDARDDLVALDILQPRVALDAILGKQPDLLVALSAVPGVQIVPGAAVRSYGVLGLIGADTDTARHIARASRIDRGLRDLVAKRVAVVSTGPELVGGNVMDTNAAVIDEMLTPAGFEVVATGAVPDEESAIVGRVLRLASEGFGVVITTGGVGAEAKDHTIEALQTCDPDLATAVLATYEVGHGRHVKPHVRVGVGEIKWTRLVALPGPTREVRAAIPVVLDGLAQAWDSARFADELARVLRACLR